MEEKYQKILKKKQGEGSARERANGGDQPSVYYNHREVDKEEHS